MNLQEKHRRALRRLRAEGQDYFARRDKAIREAYAETKAADVPLSYREIGAEVGLSHTGVQKIITESRVQDGGQASSP